ncbi:Leucine-zipper-like transcriptional regulator 1 [Linnemannia zychae]|nr:Leucine-zipper-like transcriptional regulator 1 [Linnemannia zychae]
MTTPISSTTHSSHKRSNNKPREQHRLTTATLLLSACALLLSTITTTDAVVFPIGSRRVGYATLNDVLYIQGGFDTETSGQFVSLDLSTSWATSEPAWTILKDGQVTSHLTLAPISAGSNGGSKGSILSIGGMPSNTGVAPNFLTIYDINAGSWSNLNSVKSQYPALEGHAAVSDPNTGVVYLIGGYNGTSSANFIYNSLAAYDPKSRTMISQQSGTAANSLTDVGAVWSSKRNSILTFGGSRAPPAGTNALGNDVLEYDVSSKSWKTMETSGDVPPARLDHCMAASEDGSKIVLFGGTVDGNVYFNTIYILDVKSGKWKQGQPAPTARTRMACAFHSWQFIAWGGSSGAARSTMLTYVPVVYDLNSDKWVDKYDASQTEKSSPVGAIVGGLVAVAAIGGAVAFLIIRKRRRSQQEREEAYKSQTLAANLTSMEDDNIKVAVPDSPRMEYGNEYPLNKMEGSVTSPQQQQQYPYGVQSPGATYQQYGGDHAGFVAASPYPQHQYNGQFGPGGEYGPDGQFSPYPTHMPYPPAGADYSPHQHQQQNPFMSPEDYHPSATGGGSSISSGSSNPFANASAATPTVTSATLTSGYQSPPRITPSQDPFQSTQTAPWNGTYPGQQMMSPSPGARAPQVIPESATTTSYVPPPL